MASPLVIRQAHHVDLPALHELDEIVFGHLAYPYFVWRQLFDTHRGELLLAEDTRKVLGYSLAVRTTTPGLGWFLGLGVDQAHRCHGLGLRLAQASLTLLSGNGIRRVRLCVDVKNMAAADLYRKLGFELIDEVDDYYGQGEPRQVMDLRFDNPRPAEPARASFESRDGC